MGRQDSTAAILQLHFQRRASFSVFKIEDLAVYLQFEHLMSRWFLYFLKISASVVTY